MSHWGPTMSTGWKGPSRRSLCSEPSPTLNMITKLPWMTSCYCRYCMPIWFFSLASFFLVWVFHCTGTMEEKERQDYQGMGWGEHKLHTVPAVSEHCLGVPSEHNCLHSSWQLRNRIRRNRFVRPVALPNAGNRLFPGALCTVAGWGQVSLNRTTDRLQEVQLRVQSDRKCIRRFSIYSSKTEICVGDPRQRKIAFKVSTWLSTDIFWDRVVCAETGQWKQTLSPIVLALGPHQTKPECGGNLFPIHPGSGGTERSST